MCKPMLLNMITLVLNNVTIPTFHTSQHVLALLNVPILITMT